MPFAQFPNRFRNFTGPDRHSVVIPRSIKNTAFPRIGGIDP